MDGQHFDDGADHVDAAHVGTYFRDERDSKILALKLRCGNRAMGIATSVSGGEFNTAVEQMSSVGGGTGNSATAMDSTVSGGLNRSTTTQFEWVAGGLSQPQ